MRTLGSWDDGCCHHYGLGSVIGEASWVLVVSYSPLLFLLFFLFSAPYASFGLTARLKMTFCRSWHCGDRGSGWWTLEHLRYLYLCFMFYYTSKTFFMMIISWIYLESCTNDNLTWNISWDSCLLVMYICAFWDLFVSSIFALELPITPLLGVGLSLFVQRVQ